MKTILAIGLGNPGRRYERTRHNLGIRVLQAWVDKSKEEGLRIEEWTHNSKYEADIATVFLPDARVVCVFSTVFMNNSGDTVAAMVRSLYLSAKDVLIIHDELELPFGEVSIKETGSAKGHNGVRSIHETMGTQEISRVRIGVGRPEGEQPVDEYVLGVFSEDEEEKLKSGVIDSAVETLSQAIGEKLVS